jgi:hypothetical protein
VRKFLTFFLLLAFALPAVADDQERAKYAGGTSATTTDGVSGRLDLTDDSSLTFEYAGRKVAIPYASIESWDYSNEAARHLGVLPAIVVALIRARQHRHVFRITFHDPKHGTQVAIFEVPKHRAPVLAAVLNARAEHAPRPAHSCQWSKWIDGRCTCDTQETVPCKAADSASQP